MSKPKQNEKIDEQLLSTIKHYHSFYEEPPPGIVPERKERPEDTIPDLPENQAARDFLAKAPTKGLWMPLGKEPKVMKCWRCKIYGHRSGDKECPLFISGNRKIEEFRHTFEDPMYNYVKENELKEKLKNVEMLKKLLYEKKKKKSKKKRSKTRSKSNRKHRHHKSHSPSSSSSSSTSSSSSSSDLSSTESSSESSSSGDDKEKRRKRKRKHKNTQRIKSSKRSK